MAGGFERDDVDVGYRSPARLVVVNIVFLLVEFAFTKQVVDRLVVLKRPVNRV